MSDERTRGVPKHAPPAADPCRRRLARPRAHTLRHCQRRHAARGAHLAAEDYSRLTLEHDAPLKSRTSWCATRVPSGWSWTLRTWTSREAEGDRRQGPARRPVHRAGARRQTSKVRLVIELKEDVKPQVFSLEPVVRTSTGSCSTSIRSIRRSAAGAAARTERAAQGGAFDPTTGESPRARRNRWRGPVAPGRTPTCSGAHVVIDPGHGGEDPGAVRTRGTYKERDARHRRACAT